MSSDEEYDIFGNLNDLQKNLEDQANLAFQNDPDDDSDKSMSFSETPKYKKNEKKKSASKRNLKNASKDPAEKNSVEINNTEDLAPTNVPVNRRNTRKNNNLISNTATCSSYATNDIDLSLNSSSRTEVRRSSRRVMKARRSYYNSVAAASSDIQCVDLTTSSLPVSNEVIDLESEPEDDTKSKPEMSFDDENPEIFIQIQWGDQKFETFILRKYQKFVHIFNILAERENTKLENLAFNIDSKIIFPYDTPDSIGYKPYQFIKGRVLNTKIDTEYKYNKPLKNDENIITVKVQSDRWKHPKSMQIVKTEKFRIFIIKLSEELNIGVNNIKLRFDDENINKNLTPEEIGLENGDIIDLHPNL